MRAEPVDASRPVRARWGVGQRGVGVAQAGWVRPVGEGPHRVGDDPVSMVEGTLGAVLGDRFRERELIAALRRVALRRGALGELAPHTCGGESLPFEEAAQGSSRDSVPSGRLVTPVPGGAGCEGTTRGVRARSGWGSIRVDVIGRRGGCRGGDANNRPLS